MCVLCCVISYRGASLSYDDDAHFELPENHYCTDVYNSRWTVSVWITLFCCGFSVVDLAVGTLVRATCCDPELCECRVSSINGTDCCWCIPDLAIITGTLVFGTFSYIFFSISVFFRNSISTDVFHAEHETNTTDFVEHE